LSHLTVWLTNSPADDPQGPCRTVTAEPARRPRLYAPSAADNVGGDPIRRIWHALAERDADT